MTTLRKRLIRLAYARPEVRPHLVPLLQKKQAGAGNRWPPPRNSGSYQDLREYHKHIIKMKKEEFEGSEGDGGTVHYTYTMKLPLAEFSDLLTSREFQGFVKELRREVGHYGGPGKFFQQLSMVSKPKKRGDSIILDVVVRCGYDV